jgi:hypothetical protein
MFPGRGVILVRQQINVVLFVIFVIGGDYPYSLVVFVVRCIINGHNGGGRLLFMSREFFFI